MVIKPRVVTGQDAAVLCLDALAAGATVFLCGAGASMLAPSNCPSGPRLLARALDEIITEPELRVEVAEIEAHPQWRSVVPEVIFQFVVDDVGAVPAVVYNEIGQAVPNRLHRVIAASAVLDGATIATTNFDRLFTRAHNRVEPIHLHGHVDSPSSMVATIRQVGRGLTPSVARPFRVALAAASTLIVIGYSGNDADVVDELIRIPNLRIVWFVRDDADWALVNIARVAGVANIDTVAVDLADLAQAWDDLRPAPLIPPSAASSTTSRSSVRVSRAAQATILVGCWQAVDEYERAARLAIDARANSKPTPYEAARLVAIAAHCWDRLGDYDLAAKTAADALSSPALDLRSRYLLTTELGLAAADRTPPDRATAAAALADALAAATQLAASGNLDDQALLGSAHHNLGYLEMRCFIAGQTADLQQAESEYRQALQLKEAVGDVRYVQSSARNLAALLLALGRAREAGPLQTRFEEIVTRYGMRWDHAYFYALLGQLFLAEGKPSHARPQLVIARDAFATIGGQTEWVNRLDELLQGL